MNAAEKERYYRQLRAMRIWLPIAVVLCAGWVAVHSQTPAPQTFPIPADTQQKIIKAYEAVNLAKLQLATVEAQRDAIVSEAKAAARCWPCSLSQTPQGQLVFIPDPVPSSSPSPSPR